MRVCRKCKEEKKLSDYYIRKSGYRATYCKQCEINYSKQRLKENKWYRCYTDAKQRCRKDKPYGKRGIRFYLSPEEVKQLWLRDNADKMLRPSIDRIKTSGDYSFDNCRFIEFTDNVSRVRNHLWDEKKCCISCGSSASKHKGNGFCVKCYQKERRKKLCVVL